jgi:hypothetical protein
MTVISNRTDVSEWSVFPNQTQDGRAVIMRSRLGNPDVRKFAEDNFMARARCVLVRDQINDAGMPVTTAELDEWEAKLLAELEQIGGQTYEIAVVTGAGVRDLFFAAVDGDELLAAVASVEGTFPFELQMSRVDGPREGLLNSLSPPQ